MWAKELPGRMLKLPIRVSGCLDRLEIHCCDIPVILEQVRWGAGSTCSRFCGRVIIFLNHHIVIKPISPETAAKHCFAPGNEEKEIPGRPRFDIISRWNIGRIAWIGIPVQNWIYIKLLNIATIGLPYLGLRVHTLKLGKNSFMIFERAAGCLPSIFGNSSVACNYQPTQVRKTYSVANQNSKFWQSNFKVYRPTWEHCGTTLQTLDGKQSQQLLLNIKEYRCIKF